MDCSCFIFVYCLAVQNPRESVNKLHDTLHLQSTDKQTKLIGPNYCEAQSVLSKYLLFQLEIGITTISLVY